MIKQAYFKTTKKSIPVMIDITSTGLKFWDPTKPHVIFEITDQSQQQPPARPARPDSFDRVLSMTPLDVLHYFEQSKELAVHAADVAKAFVDNGLIAPQTGKNRPQNDSQLLQDIKATKHLVNPSQADIAEVLFGDRTRTGGSYRRRILKVIQSKTTTTTSPETQQTPVVVKRAA